MQVSAPPRHDCSPIVLSQRMQKPCACASFCRLQTRSSSYNVELMNVKTMSLCRKFHLRGRLNSIIIEQVGAKTMSLCRFSTQANADACLNTSSKKCLSVSNSVSLCKFLSLKDAKRQSHVSYTNPKTQFVCLQKQWACAGKRPFFSPNARHKNRSFLDSPGLVTTKECI